MKGELITVRGQVQGVGFRPNVWRIATELGLRGEVCNTGSGVEIRVFGEGVEQFTRRLIDERPPLARIDALERRPLGGPAPDAFAIAPTRAGPMRSAVTPDAAVCEACAEEVRDPFAHRYRYAFANCTHCGPRFSIVDGAPYDRARTTMRDFPMCEKCAAEYADPADRRFHAQPIACHACGPRAVFEKLGAGAVNSEAFSMMDDVDAAGGALANGHIVAIKGIGGYHLACDATRADVVARLRQRKRRPSKAFALMARDLDAIRACCEVSEAEAALLMSPAAPIVLLRRRADALPEALAPGLDRLGFMLPHTPLHQLMLRRMPRPIVMTSGNVSGEPQCFRDDDARARLAGVADFALTHNREIANRIDDSVARVDLGAPRVLRRARGYAPVALPLPPGFDGARDVLAMGAELKNTFCLVKDGEAILSQHMGDLEDAATSDEAAHNLNLYRELYAHRPVAVAVDLHPDYLSTRRGRALGLPVIEVQHHHAHIAACMAENGWPRDAGPVLGVALDGLGLGPDGTLWGGEFLACDYLSCERLATFKPVAMPGGAAAAREPWRNAYAHLQAEMGWLEFDMNFGHLDIARRLGEAPRVTLDAMIRSATNSPLSSSCGRLFDAAAALCGLAWGAQGYEGEAAMRFEAAIDAAALKEPDDLAYPFTIPRLRGSNLPYVEPLAVWRALLGDLHLGTPVGVIAARFHRGLARAIITMVTKLVGSDNKYLAVALSGGCFQNATLFALVHEGLAARGLRVLSHSRVPANDGGLALGQAVVALARLAQS